MAPGSGSDGHGPPLRARMGATAEDLDPLVPHLPAELESPALDGVELTLREHSLGVFEAVLKQFQKPKIVSFWQIFVVEASIGFEAALDIWRAVDSP